jgi:DNA repair protein RecN (Recombination protein N)
MLRELHISNLAVIEDVTVEFSSGLNCFTGQTGAGKSLIIGAFELLLGLRSGGAAEMMRPGADEARVSGVFEVDDADVAGQIGAIADVKLESGEPLLITRKVYASGRTSVSLNGQPATAPMVRAIGELLVDVHGQHDHQYLLRPSNQLTVLDAFGRSADLRARFATIHGEITSLSRRLEELAASQSLRRQQVELYEFQAQEIDAADPIAGEFVELKARHAMLNNLTKLKRDAGLAHAALYDNEGSIIERLQMLTHLLGDMAQLDEDVREVSEQVKSATLSLQDASFELARYADRLDHDPAELAEIEDRLNTLNRLISKYGSNRRRSSGSASRREPDQPANADPLAEVLACRAEIEAQLGQLRGDSDDCERLESRIAALSRELELVGTELTAKRQAAGKRIKPLVEAELKELGMSEAAFEVSFEEAAGGDTGSDGSVADHGSPEAGPPFTSSGFDRVEMLVRTNPGQPARPLRKVASGGELSRIMLALKSILAHSDRISVLVFDEIDSNIGGRMGTVIGRKLRELAGGVAGLGGKSKGKKRDSAGGAPGGDGRHQILCITHLPQIAAFADRHMRIAKSVTGKGGAKQTRTTVTRLEGAERIEELAEMLAGKDVTTTTRKQVTEMIDAAEVSPA